MGKHDPRIDAYIAKSADFAKPILNHLRKLVHAACPDVEETMKWSFPHFLHKGILCSMASFKNHCAFGFWKGALIFGKTKGSSDDEKQAMGQFGRITAISDLSDEKTLTGYLKEAARLNEAGVKVPAKPKAKEKNDLVVPDYFVSALKTNKQALVTFESFSYSHKKEYLEWITEAKGEETRQRRMATAIEWMTEGKSRHWKYARC
ncbi:MAG: YdeI/OmpD-associated family protein [Verrucomicrobia bacterium]|nr:YdeI/OmpD-associated family protein [Verrucomicrobiota bacterium]